MGRCSLCRDWLSEDRLERLRSAEADLRKALRLRPDHADAQRCIGDGANVHATAPLKASPNVSARWSLTETSPPPTLDRLG